MTISCPHKRLRVAASLAPMPGHETSDYALAFLRRAVNHIAYFDVAPDHKRLLDIATEIVGGDQSVARWAALTAELERVKKLRPKIIGVDRASGPDISVQWYRRGNMA